MKSLLEFLLIHIVDNPDAVSVEESVEGETTVYTLHVDPADMGRVIGKAGKVINAIRSIAKVRAMKEKKFVVIRIADQEISPQN